MKEEKRQQQTQIQSCVRQKKWLARGLFVRIDFFLPRRSVHLSEKSEAKFLAGEELKRTQELCVIALRNNEGEILEMGRQ